jgi:hypothetical protein
MVPGLNAQPVRVQKNRRKTVHMMFGPGLAAMAMKPFTGTLVQCRQMGWESTTGHAGPGPYTETITHITPGITNILSRTAQHIKYHHN